MYRTVERLKTKQSIGRCKQKMIKENVEIKLGHGGFSNTWSNSLKFFNFEKRLNRLNN